MVRDFASQKNLAPRSLPGFPAAPSEENDNRWNRRHQPKSRGHRPRHRGRNPAIYNEQIAQQKSHRQPQLFDEKDRKIPRSGEMALINTLESSNCFGHIVHEI